MNTHAYSDIRMHSHIPTCQYMLISHIYLLPSEAMHQRVL